VSESVPVSPSRTALIARSTLIVMIAFGAAKVISLVQTLVIARTFGISADYDAFIAANRLPEIIFNVIAGGSIGVAFIPVFSGLLAKGDQKAAWNTASYVANTIFSLTCLVSLLVFVFAPMLVSQVIAPGFAPEIQAKTVEMMRILLFTTIIFSVSGLLSGILQSHNRFLLPAIAPVMYDLGILFGVLFLVSPLGIYGLPIGALIGAALHLGVQVPGLLRLNARWTPSFGWRDPHFRKIILLMVPRIGDLGLISLSAIVAGNILSQLGEGATSAYDWGWRLMQIPETLIGTAMGVVIFPTLAALSSVGDVDGKRAAMSGSLRFIFIATIPSAVVLIVAGQPLLSLLEGGAFDAQATVLVYSTLQFFAIGVIVHSVLEVIARSFFADKDTFTPLLVAIGGAVVNIGVALVFSGVLNGTASPDKVGFIALANTLGVLFEVVVLMLILHRRWGGLNEQSMAITASKTLFASLLMGAAIIAVNAGWGMIGLANGGTVMTIVQIVLMLLIGGVVFAISAYLLKLTEFHDAIHQIRARFARKSSQQVPA
jgi:putative peptidoglycan lipid II flippase